MSILVEIGAGRLSLLVMGSLGGEDRQQGLDSTGIEFDATLLSPLLCQLVIGIQTLGERVETLLSVESIDNLHGLREEFTAHVPDPFRSVSKNDLPRRLPETAALGLTLHPLSELRKLGVVSKVAALSMAAV